MGEWVKYHSLRSLIKVIGSFSLYFFFKFHGGMGKVSELWVSQQKLLGDKLVTKRNYLELFDYFMGECLLTFFFFPINFMGNVY